MKAIRFCVLGLLLVQSVRSACGSTSAAPRVGAPAPPLQVASWLKGTPVSSFLPGRVYVIDIWAPWCGPCLGGMKHLTELQHRDRARGLRVIGVTGPDDYGSTLAKARKVLADKKNDVDYSVGWDQGRRFYGAWMALEASAGWPWCFVVDRAGRIAYIGHPEKLDAVLEQVLAGTFDLKAAAERYARRADALEKAAVFDRAYVAAEWPKAEGLYREILEVDEGVAAGLAAHEYKILAYRMKDAKRAAEYGRLALATFLHDDRGMLTRLAEMILDPKLEIAPRDLDLAGRCAERADVLADGQDSHTAATLARVFYAQGNREKAIEVQRRAVRTADPGDRGELQKTLDSYAATRG